MSKLQKSPPAMQRQASSEDRGSSGGQCILRRETDDANAGSPAGFDRNPMLDGSLSRPSGTDLIFRQMLKYAEDMAELFKQESKRQRAMERMQRKLKEEVEARRKAERAFSAITRRLELTIARRTNAI